jgi:hypothetical protein
LVRYRDGAGRAAIADRRRSCFVICSALDLQLSLADTQGFREVLIARALTRLSPEEIAAIPHKALP